MPGAQSRGVHAVVASLRKQLWVVHIVAGSSSRLNSGKVVNTGSSGVGSMSVDRPVLAGGGYIAHIRGADGGSIIRFSVFEAVAKTPKVLLLSRNLQHYRHGKRDVESVGGGGKRGWSVPRLVARILQ